MYLGAWNIDEYLTFPVNTHNQSTGAATDDDAVPSYRVYEDETGTAILSGSLAKLDDTNTTGFYSEQIQLTAANGFEIGKSYTIYIECTVAAVVFTKSHTFQVKTVAAEVWDRILTGATHNISTSAGRRLRTLQDFGLYEGGAVWVDTVNGVAGTVDFENGVVNNPVNSIADARTIADSVGLKTFHILSGSSITLAQAFDNFVFTGSAYTVDLNGQSINGSWIQFATIVGNDDGSNVIPCRYLRCILGSNTLGLSYFGECAFAGDMVLAEAGTYIADACLSGIAGTATPSIDFQNENENKYFNMRHYSGGIELKNFGHGTAEHVMSLEGDGQVVFNANCSNADSADVLAIRGNFTITDNVIGGWDGTLSDLARFDSGSLVDDVWDEILTGSTHNIAASAGKRLRTIPTIVIREDTAQGPGGNDNQIQLDTGASAVDGAYDPALVVIVGGTGVGQSRLILEYVGSTKIATVDRDWKVKPDATSEYVVYADAGREHVNEGNAQAGAASTITLNTLASDYDNEYNQQLIFIRSGKGQDQVRLVKSYDGTTKIATIYDTWAVIPDATTAYVMLPNATNPDLAAGLTLALANLALLMGAGFNTATDSNEAIRNQGDAAWVTGVGPGTGAISWEYTLVNSVGGAPIPDCEVWVTTDIAGAITVGEGITDAFGKVTFLLDGGTYYFWRRKSGWSFDNPDTEVVSL